MPFHISSTIGNDKNYSQVTWYSGESTSVYSFHPIIFKIINILSCRVYNLKITGHKVCKTKLIQNTLILVNVSKNVEMLSVLSLWSVFKQWIG